MMMTKYTILGPKKENKLEVDSSAKLCGSSPPQPTESSLLDSHQRRRSLNNNNGDVDCFAPRKFPDKDDGEWSPLPFSHHHHHCGNKTSSLLSPTASDNVHCNRTILNGLRDDVISHQNISLLSSEKTSSCFSLKSNCDRQDRLVAGTALLQNNTVSTTTSQQQQQEDPEVRRNVECSGTPLGGSSTSSSSSSIKIDQSTAEDRDNLGHTPEVELISLLTGGGNHFAVEETAPIPKYKLRIDTVTEFQGYQHNDWLIETPLIDLNAPIDLNPVILRETFKLFLQSGQRLTQMTKVYNDIEALTQLLEEKERDVELAARIGQSLLDQNEQQTERIGELEQELLVAKDTIVQLKHDISSKSDLLKFYIAKDEEADLEEDQEDSNELNLTSISSFPSISKDAAALLDDLERRVRSLEEENNRLKCEKESKKTDLEDEERKELQLINECARRLNTTNRQIATFQEELAKKTEENQRLVKEVQNLTGQVNALEKQIRKMKIENDELMGAVNLAHECQAELTIELIDVKDKHTTLLGAFHEIQKECRQLRQQQFNDPIFSYVDSLAYELENSFNDEIIDTQHDGHQMGHQQGGNCFTPDSLLSSDSFYTTSPYSSIIVNTSAISSSSQQPPSSSNQNAPTSFSTSIITTKATISLSSSFGQVTLPQPLQSTSRKPTATIMPNNSTMKAPCSSAAARAHHRSLFLTDKLRYIKPMEGSQILHHWRRLANPNLNDLFEDKDRYISRIKANLIAVEVANRLPAPPAASSEPGPSDESTARQPPPSSSMYHNNFVTTNSVFTLTTTSLSHTKETMTEVTNTFSSVQPSTGKNPRFSIIDQQYQKKLASADALAQQLQNRKSLVEQVRNILQVDNLSSGSSKPFEKSKARTEVSPASTSPLKKKIDDSQNKPEPNNAKGLNELAKLFSLEVPIGKRPAGSGGNRMVTKVTMMPINDGTSSTSIISEKTGGYSNNLSVLRNLRKGGLI